MHVVYPIVALVLALATLHTGCFRDTEACETRQDCFSRERCIAGTCVANTPSPPSNNDRSNNTQPPTPTGPQEVQCPESRPDLCDENFCTDLGGDPLNCGECGEVCRLGEVCDEGDCIEIRDCRQQGCAGQSFCDEDDGKCKPGCERDEQCEGGASCNLETNVCTCNEGFHACSGTCFDSSSPNSCGTSCVPCPTDPNGVATCDEGRCGIECAETARRCGDACAACPQGDPVLETACDESLCVATRCEEGYEICEMGCCPIMSAPVPDEAVVANGAGPTSIAVDDSGTPHILYHDDALEDLVYVTWDGMSWSSTVLDGSMASVGQAHAIDSGPGGVLEVAYRDEDNGDVKALSFDGANWLAPSMVAGFNDVGAALDIARSPSGAVAISYYDATEQTMIVSLRQPGAMVWTRKIVAFDVTAPNALAIAPMDRLRVSYFRTNGSLGLSFRDMLGNWADETIAVGPGLGELVDLQVNSLGFPLVLYLQTDTDTLSFQARNGEAWGPLELIDNGTAVEGCAKMVLDGAGTPHVIYAASETSDLRYARRGAADTWMVRDLATGGDVGTQCDLAIDDQDVLHASFLDRSQGTVRYLRFK